MSRNVLRCCQARGRHWVQSLTPTNPTVKCLRFLIQSAARWKPLKASLRLQYTFGSTIFFKFGFLGQSSGRRIISNFFKKVLKKARYWRRNGGFTFSPEVKVYLLIDSPMARTQSTETVFAGITCIDVTNWLLSWSALLLWLPSIFGISCNSIK